MITIERARQILACYGGNPHRWPEAERADMQLLLASDSELRKLHRQALQLDGRLTELFAFAEEETAFRPLADKILAGLPERTVVDPGPVGRAPRKLRDRFAALWAPPARWSLAGAALAMLIALGLAQFGGQSVSPQTGDRGDAWLLMVEALDDNSSDLELFAVLEPELSEDDLDIL